MIAKTFYQQALYELNTGKLDQALWALVWTKADGDDAKARASYVKRRALEVYSAEQRRSARTPLTWWAIGLCVAANTLYLSWCFHFPGGTGFVALLGAFAGFNLLPAMACAGLLWLGRYRLLTLWKPALWSSVSVMALMLVLTCIDTRNRYHPATPSHSYPVTFANGKLGAIDSDVPLTPAQLQAQLEVYNRMDAADAATAVQDQRTHETDKAKFWRQQFVRGFNAPFQSIAHLL